MKFTLNWLKDHLDTDVSLDQICETLTAIGLEVEEIVDPNQTLSAFKVAHVVEAEQHPNADRLRVCKVETGEGIVQVVCGAPNARAGMKGVFAPAGTYVPGSDLLLKPTKIRGVESNGMLCSARELEIGDDHDGIIELSEDAEIGSAAAIALGADDPMIEIAITPNRPDCLGVYGIARDLAAAGLGELKEPGSAQGIDAVKGTFDSPVTVSRANAGEACPIFTGRFVRGVRNGPSPDWLQKRLRAIGLRPISALVDITNFVSYDRGRPLHVYDVDKLNGNLEARLAKAGEELLALDGKSYELDAQMCAIADEAGVVGIGGVMGGEKTGCTDGTVDVLIECANFDPVNVARTGRVLNINSDARYRNERGVDRQFVVHGLELATRMVIDLCGGEPSHVMCDQSPPPAPRKIDFDTAQVERLTGLSLSQDRIIETLAALGFDPETGGEHINATVPSWRPDVEGQADLVEEVVRIEGLEKVPSSPMSQAPVSTPAVLTVSQMRVRRAKRSAAAVGMFETVNWSFIPEPHAGAFGAPQGGGELRLANPISVEMSTMRPSLLPGLLAAVQRNADRGERDIKLFEVGQIFSGLDVDGQSNVASGVLWGVPNRHWRDPVDAYDVYDAKAAALSILSGAGGPANAQITTNVPDWFHPGRSGAIQLGPKNILGYFGEIHPRLASQFDIDGRVGAFEIFLDAFPTPKSKPARTRPVLEKSDLMPVRRDFAFLVGADIESAAIVRAARGADKALIVDVSVFDVYAGKGVPDEQKSVGIEITLQPTKKTLTDADIETVSKQIIGAVQKATGGTLRN